MAFRYLTFSRRCFLLLAPLLMAGLLTSRAVAQGDSPSAVPATLLWEGDHLARLRAGDLSGDDATLAPAIESLRQRAEKAIKRGPYSVVTHGELAASGDPHDYVSFGPYWWPNPDTPDGLPYVRRDGVPNRKLIAQGDRVQLSAMAADVTDLTLAGYLLDNPHYSRHAAYLLRAWFLDPATRMNPNLRHGQLIRGVNTGRYIGIIDSVSFVPCLDSALLLEFSDEWTADDQQQLRDWFREYLDWLLHDSMGKQEGATKNNHATYYDLQVAAMALYVGDRETAQQVLAQVPSRRYATQIEPDGRQPHEIARTRGLGYSFANLRGCCLLARLAEHVELNFWQTEEGEENRLRQAADFLHPYVVDPESWPYQEITPETVPSTREVGYLLTTRLGDKKYLEMAKPNPQAQQRDVTPLVYSQAPAR